MIKKVVFIFIAAILIGILSLNVISHVKYDIKTQVQILDDGTIWKRILFWNKNDQLHKIISEFREKGKKTQRSILYFKEGKEIIEDGDEYIKQEADFKKSKIIAPKLPTYHAVYSQNKFIVIRESDENGDKIIDEKSYYKNGILCMSVDSSKKSWKFNVWHYYNNDGKFIYSEYDSDGDGKADKKGRPPVDPRNIITYKMGQKFEK